MTTQGTVSAPTADVCIRCGACCRGRAGTVLVSANDESRWRRGFYFNWIDGLVPGHFGCKGLPTRPNGDCAYLFRDGALTYCTIHLHRPDTCVAFQAHSCQCLEYRRHGGRD